MNKMLEKTLGHQTCRQTAQRVLCLIGIHKHW